MPTPKGPRKGTCAAAIVEAAAKKTAANAAKPKPKVTPPPATPTP